MADWKETAVRELAADEDLDFDDMEVSEDNSTFGADIWVDIGNRQYLVFKNEDAAERGAVLYVREMLSDEPELFNQEWLQGYLSMTPTDTRVYAIDLVGERFDESEMTNEEVIEEADAENEVDAALEPLEEAAEEAQDASDEYEGDDEDEENRLWKAANAASDALYDGRDAAMAQVASQHREDLESAAIAEIRKELEDDPVGYFEMHFGDTAAQLLERHIVSIDLDEAAQAAVDEDGVAHFLSGYDGNQIDLPSGAVAFRHN